MADLITPEITSFFEYLERQFGKIMYAGIIAAILGGLVLMSAVPTAIALGWDYWWLSLPQILYGALCIIVGALAFLGVYKLFFLAPATPVMDLTRSLSIIALFLSALSLIEIIVSGIAFMNLSNLLLAIFPIISIVINYVIAQSIGAIKGFTIPPLGG